MELLVSKFEYGKEQKKLVANLPEDASICSLYHAAVLKLSNALNEININNLVDVTVDDATMKQYLLKVLNADI